MQLSSALMLLFQTLHTKTCQHQGQGHMQPWVGATAAASSPLGLPIRLGVNRSQHRQVSKGVQGGPCWFSSQHTEASYLTISMNSWSWGKDTTPEKREVRTCERESLACLTATLVPGSQYRPKLHNTPDQLPFPPECCLVPKMTQQVRAHTALP